MTTASQSSAWSEKPSLHCNRSDQAAARGAAAPCHLRPWLLCRAAPLDECPIHDDLVTLSLRALAETGTGSQAPTTSRSTTGTSIASLDGDGFNWNLNAWMQTGRGRDRRRGT